jgi:hypothetical protein
MHTPHVIFGESFSGMVASVPGAARRRPRATAIQASISRNVDIIAAIGK